MRRSQNFFGLDPDHDPDSKDDIVTAEMAIPVNKEIHLLMHAKDVGHSFYVRELRVQQDFVPGLDVSLHFTATKIGRYEIVCTQLCGLGHYNMKAYLDVMSQQDFDDWLKKEAGNAVAVPARTMRGWMETSLLEVRQMHDMSAHAAQHHAPPTSFIRKHVFSLDHKVIGKQYYASGLGRGSLPEWCFPGSCASTWVGLTPRSPACNCFRRLALRAG